MSNKEIYRKTLVFSIRRLLFDIIALALLGGLCAIGFFLTDKLTDNGLIGLLIGLVVGIIIIAVVSRFISYMYKAGQIAMMTRALTENELPDNVVAEGKKVVKERFLTVAIYFAATSAIKSLFNALSNAISGVGRSVGGDAGGAVGSAIGIVINTIVAYLCDCCLGWVFFRTTRNAFKAICEGAVIFFKHGKTFARNMGRIFGLGALSLVLIAGPLTGVFYLFFSQYSATFQILAAEFAESESNGLRALLSNPVTLAVVVSFIAAVIIWAIIHSVFIRPFVLVGVLRNYLESGKQDIPEESSFSMLKGKSSKFDKLEKKLA